MRLSSGPTAGCNEATGYDDGFGERIARSLYEDREEQIMVEQISPVDHFPNVLKHFSDERLLKLTIQFVHVAQDGSADRFIHERTAMCQQECERRGIRSPRWRHRPTALVA